MNQLISGCELLNLYLYYNSDQKTSAEHTLKLQNQYKTTFFSPLLVVTLTLEVGSGGSGDTYLNPGSRWW